MLKRNLNTTFHDSPLTMIKVNLLSLARRAQIRGCRLPYSSLTTPPHSATTVSPVVPKHTRLFLASLHGPPFSIFSILLRQTSRLLPSGIQSWHPHAGANAALLCSVHCIYHQHGKFPFFCDLITYWTVSYSCPWTWQIVVLRKCSLNERINQRFEEIIENREYGQCGKRGFKRSQEVREFRGQKRLLSLRVRKIRGESER